ncbi:DNA mismatch repair protein MutS2 [Anaerosphaera aminiphila DSM 21120]|uniref:Endonuclease MutS2 n=1 Tax=Anaerosphaera aminiphila DSM 21120 TaxID=1120995 RepID=A0A1M5T2L0_9FIRM|nr:endonuclease MutS2 [Anaerosphaera aminiphila]SHH44593.1 DNA mismatch repair protein MutS2 [Anaerosphaera aminiphila DSM 21120]
MDNLIEKSERVLEFNKILEILNSMVVSDLGRTKVSEVLISTDIDEINKRLDETSEASNIIVKKGEPPLFGIYPMKNYMKRVKIGGILNPGALLQISDFLRVSRYLRRYLNIEEREESYPILESLALSLGTYKSIEDEINNAIVSENEISDSASPKLSSIRRQILRKKDSIRDKLNSIVTSDSDRQFLQDSIVTIREGRYVVPVKQENKSKVKGLVHDVSSSGQTVYIEPMAVVNLNNELKTLQAEERDEIDRILKVLSESVSEISYQVEANEEILKELDFIFAKGKLSLEQKANRPFLNDRCYINLKEARHPLLNVKEVVPINIHLGDDFTSLIITGPNTGGKTVSLKTLGLLSLMTQYGLHIPAQESSEMGIFSDVLADIGDEQSIEQSLSTFSSHMVNIVEILKRASEKSLVLFDELGAGTDPTEGAALARAIMDYMLQRKIRTVSTTHYNQLKIYALTVEGVENASMEFNIDTLSPTYKLLIGVPGKSNAFEISKRLGLPDNIIDSARELISEDNIEFEKVLQSIEEDRTKIEEHKVKAERGQLELESKNEELKREIDKVKLQKDKVIKDAKIEAKKILNQAKGEMDLILDEINLIRDELTTEQAKRLQQAQDMLRDNYKSVSDDGFEVKLEKAKNPAKNLKIGDTVGSVSLNTEGIVLELPDNSGNVLVQMGMIKMKLPKNTLVHSTASEDKSKTKMKKIIDTKSRYIKSEIDVRGKNFDEAKIIVDKYIDDAYLSGIKSVRIIHGKGTGVLRDKLRADLKRNKHVKSIKDASYNEGGMGVSIVDLE